MAQITVIKKEGSKGMNSRYGSESQLTWKRIIVKHIRAIAERKGDDSGNLIIKAHYLRKR